MIVLRLPPFPLEVKYDVPEANTEYFLYIENDDETVSGSNTLTSNSNSQITYTLTGDFVKYDNDYNVTIYESVDEEPGNLVVEDILTVVRPYVNPNTLGTTATEIANASYNERIARAIIDSVVGTRFTFEKKILETVGQGTDYMPLWNSAYKINQVYENGKLVFDISENIPALDGYNYLISKDTTAIVKVATDSLSSDSFNRAERKPLKYRDAGSDSFYAYAPYENFDNLWTNTKNPSVGFPEGYDYIFVYEAGYKVIPNDIREATLMLIDDIACGKMDHYKAYVSDYKTDQFSLKYNSSKFSGTGNILVDTILDKYITDLRTPGIL
jgi:hypothetical protein